MITYRGFTVLGTSGEYGWEAPEEYAGAICAAVFDHMSEVETSIDQYIEAQEFKGPWSVAVFKIDRAYGGPEEGGWYYGCGEPVLSPDWPLPVFYATHAEALAGREAMDSEIAKLGLNDGLPSINSILSEGRYAAQISDGMPTHFPKERPHYE